MCCGVFCARTRRANIFPLRTGGHEPERGVHELGSAGLSSSSSLPGHGISAAMNSSQLSGPTPCSLASSYIESMKTFCTSKPCEASLSLRPIASFLKARYL
jgi:hypothetical protein